ncbi:unnamed protein product [Phytophthora fragariaefolia]|uniref:Unnamed protein product n=1 Tax=Phytophthora fragariaefolia TaxID=1490495 RepID=A0A9W6U015_9STRA|nr:unnamed protein product [Phytophthora fragariaefolia]
MEEEDVLEGVRIVCHQHSRIAALPHVVHLINEFADNISPSALTDLLKAGTKGLFLHVLRDVECSAKLLRYEKMRQYRLAMYLIPSKMTMGEGKLNAIKELYKRYLGTVDAKTIAAVAKVPELPVLKWLYSCQPKMFTNAVWTHLFENASLEGQADVVHWLVELFPDTVRRPVFAVHGGHFDLVQWLLKHTSWDEISRQRAFSAAAKEGKLEIAKLLYQHKPAMTRLYWPPEAITSLEIVQWLREKNFWRFDELVLDTAIKRGHLEMVQWLHVNYSQHFTANARDSAAEYGHLELVKFFHANRTEGCTKKAMNSAAKNGHLEVVQWLHENRTEGCTTDAMDSAAYKGHLHILRWLHANRNEGCTVQAMVLSSWEKSYLDVGKWLHEYRGLRLPSTFVNVAAAAGKIELISWLHFNGKGTWSKETMDEAANHGHVKVVKFLHKHRNEGCTKHAMVKAVRYNHLDVVKWLTANKRKTSTVKPMNLAAAHGHLEVVKWLHENGRGGCTTVAMTAAANGGHLSVMKFLAANYSLNWSEKAIAKAQKNGHTTVVKWLYFHLGMRLLPAFAINAARNDYIDLLEFMSTETDFCRNTTVFYSADGNRHPEAVQWYKDHYGNPRKRKRRQV